MSELARCNKCGSERVAWRKSASGARYLINVVVWTADDNAAIQRVYPRGLHSETCDADAARMAELTEAMRQDAARAAGRSAYARHAARLRTLTIDTLEQRLAALASLDRVRVYAHDAYLAKY